MSPIPIIQCHGSENTFFLINHLDLPENFSMHNRAQLSQLLCRKTTDWEGADGILIMEHSSAMRFRMRIYNADGSEALMCGNGMRIAGRWALEQENTSKTAVENVTGLEYLVEKDRTYYPNIEATTIAFPSANFQANEFIKGITSEMFHQKTIPHFQEAYKFTAIAMPNPHIVAIVENIDTEALVIIGTEANKRKDVFPEGVNVSFVQKKGKKHLFVATYERGVGLTNACGTAMIASTITMQLADEIPKVEWIKVQNKGGFIKVRIAEDWSTQMIGNANYVFKTNLIALDLDNNKFETDQKIYFNEEIAAYKTLKDNL